MPLVIPLVVLLALFVSYGLAATARPVSGGITGWLQGTLGLAAGLFVLPLKAALSLTKYLTHALGFHYEAIERAGIKWVAQLADYVYLVGYWSLYWPIELGHVVTALIRIEIPKAVNARTRPIARQAAAAEAQAKAAAGLAHTIPHVAKGHDVTVKVNTIKTVAMPHAAEWDWITNHWKAVRRAVIGAAAIGLAIPGAVSHPIPLPHALRGIRSRLHRLEGKVTARGIATAIAGAGALSLLRTLRCPNFLKYGPKLCNVDNSLLDSLLLDALAIASVISVVEFAEGMQAIEGEAVAILAAGIREFPKP